MIVHHTGIIVKDIEKNISIYTKLGYKQVSDIVIDPIQNNRIVFIDNQHTVELIEPMGEKSSIYRFKEGLHHICYEVACLETLIDNFKAMKIGKIFTKPMPAFAMNNRKVLFACLTNGLFVEFLQQEVE